MVAPVIMKFGTSEQKATFLPKYSLGDVWFCQGYSEPGSGSDLASLKTKAEDMEDHYLVNGVRLGPCGAICRIGCFVWSEQQLENSADGH